MCQLCLDHLGPDFESLGNLRAGHCLKSLAHQFVVAVAHPPQGAPNGVLAHATGMVCNATPTIVHRDWATAPATGSPGYTHAHSVS